MNAREVYELVKDIPDIEELLDSRMMAWTGSSFLMMSRGIDYALVPEDALDLIVGAMKREMGEDWYGCVSVFYAEHNKFRWRAEYTSKAWPDRDLRVYADTEAEAVIAAWKAWKEAK